MSAGLALGGVAHKPWRSMDAELLLVGATPDPAVFGKVAEILLAGAQGYEHNTFKIELAKLAIVRALTQAATGGRPV